MITSGHKWGGFRWGEVGVVKMVRSEEKLAPVKKSSSTIPPIFDQRKLSDQVIKSGMATSLMLWTEGVLPPVFMRIQGRAPIRLYHSSHHHV